MDTQTITEPTAEQIAAVVTPDAVVDVLKKHTRGGHHSNMKFETVARRLFPAARPSALYDVERALSRIISFGKQRPANVRRVRREVFCYVTDEQLQQEAAERAAERANLQAARDAVAAAVASMGLRPDADDDERYSIDGLSVKLSTWGGRIDVKVWGTGERSRLNDVHPSRIEAAIRWAVRTHRERLAFQTPAE